MSDMSQTAADNRPTPRSISTLLIWAVYLPMAIALAVLFPMDYWHEMEDAIAEKHASLEEEAMTIYEGLSSLTQRGRREPVQRYIDTVCARMQETRSPGHHIAVRWNTSILQAECHQRASSEMVRAMQQAAESSTHRAAVGDETLVIGAFMGNDVDVYVSEFTTHIRRSIQREVLLHFGVLVALAVATAAIVNVVLWWIVARQVTQLSNTVSRVAYGDYELNANGFHSREMNELSDAIQQMSETLSNNARDRRAQMDRARGIQEHLLPNGVVIPDLTVAHIFQPADEVAGDYYDLIRLPDDTWLICVADVSGHGVAAAMGAAMLKALVLHATERHGEPSKIMQFVNDRLPALLSDEYITMFLARWDAESHRLDYASAGHEPGLLLTPSGELRELRATGLPLGIDRTADWEAESIEIAAGQRLLLTTDGVAEASDPDGELFSRKRLAELAENCVDNLPKDAVALIQNAVIGHQRGQRPADDVTILVLEFNAVKLGPG